MSSDRIAASLANNELIAVNSSEESSSSSIQSISSSSVQLINPPSSCSELGSGSASLTNVGFGSVSQKEQPLRFYSILFEYENNDFKTLKFRVDDIGTHYKQAFYSKKIAISYIEPEYRVEVYCLNMSSIYKMLSKLKKNEFGLIKDKKKLLANEMKVEEEVGLMISRTIPIKENAKFITYCDSHADNLLMNIGIQLHYRTKLMTIHLGDVLKPRTDKWYQNIEKDFLTPIREARALEMMNNCIQWSAINDVKGPFIVIKGNHDNTTKISNVCLIAVSSKLQLVFQHAFMPSIYYENIRLGKRFQIYNDEYKDFEFLTLETSDLHIGHFHCRFRENKRNHDEESKFVIEENVTRWIRMLMKPEYTYNPFMYYGHELNSFSLSINIDTASKIPIKKEYKWQLADGENPKLCYRAQKDVNSIIHPQKTSLYHRIIPLDGMDGTSKEEKTIKNEFKRVEPEPVIETSNSIKITSSNASWLKLNPEETFAERMRRNVK